MTLRAASLMLLVSVTVLMPIVPGDAVQDARVSLPTPVAQGPGGRYDPRISGRVIIWAQMAGRGGRSPIPHYRIYARTLSPGSRPQAITSSAVIDPLNQVSISRRTVVWTDCRFCRRVAGMPGYAGTRIWGKGLLSRHGFLISSVNGDASSAQISGNWVVWLQRGSASSTSIMARNLDTGRTTSVARGPAMKSLPDISGTTVVWNERERRGWGVFGRDLSGGGEFSIARHPGRGNDLLAPQIDGSIVLWVNRTYRTGVDTIEGENLQTHTLVHVVRLPSGSSRGGQYPDFAISGTLVVWQQRPARSRMRSRSSAILGANLATGRSFTVIDDGSDNEAPSISRRTVVWQQSVRRAGHLSSAVYAATVAPEP